jgi:hypothetical protein
VVVRAASVIEDGRLEMPLSSMSCAEVVARLYFFN